MKPINEFIVAGKKLTFEEANNNIPTGYRLPTQKELMLMYCNNDETKFKLPKGNVWSSTEFFLKNGISTSVFAIQFSNGYTATIKKNIKLTTIYVK